MGELPLAGRLTTVSGEGRLSRPLRPGRVASRRLPVQDVNGELDDAINLVARSVHQPEDDRFGAFTLPVVNVSYTFNPSYGSVGGDGPITGGIGRHPYRERFTLARRATVATPETEVRAFFAFPTEGGVSPMLKTVLSSIYS